MEREQMLQQVIGFYKQALADALEEKFAYQALSNGYAKQVEELQKQIELQKVDNEEDK